MRAAAQAAPPRDSDGKGSSRRDASCCGWSPSALDAARKFSVHRKKRNKDIVFREDSTQPTKRQEGGGALSEIRLQKGSAAERAHICCVSCICVLGVENAHARACVMNTLTARDMQGARCYVTYRTHA